MKIIHCYLSIQFNVLNFFLKNAFNLNIHKVREKKSISLSNTNINKFYSIKKSTKPIEKCSSISWSGSERFRTCYIEIEIEIGEKLVIFQLLQIHLQIALNKKKIFQKGQSTPTFQNCFSKAFHFTGTPFFELVFLLNRYKTYVFNIVFNSICFSGQTYNSIQKCMAIIECTEMINMLIPY